MEKGARKLRFDIYPQPDLLAALDRWRGAQPDVPNRAEAARRVLEEALAAKGYFKAPRKRKAPE